MLEGEDEDNEEISTDEVVKLHSNKKSKEANMRDIVTGKDDDGDADEVQYDTSIASPVQRNIGLEATAMNQIDATLNTVVKRRQNRKEEEKNAPTKEHTLDRIVGLKANKNR